VNSKTSRISVCNALDTLIINKNISESTLKELFQKLVEK
jgi:gamma-glutamyl phosphate reductase